MDSMEVGSPSESSSGEEEEERATLSQLVFQEYVPHPDITGRPHPTAICESASLSYVKSPRIWIHLNISDSAKENLSVLQIETASLASQKHEEFLPNQFRAGFYIGDGTGVGKGRTLAAVILHNYNEGRQKSLFVSASGILEYALQNDLKVLEYKAAIFAPKNYDSIKRTKGVLYATYSSLISKSIEGGTRFKQIFKWLGKNFDGLIILDECHRAKKYSQDEKVCTKIGLKVVQLQRLFPKARVLYSSATGAWEPPHMAYLWRLGLWGGEWCSSSLDFVRQMENRGVEAMELLAMELKLTGFFVARQLSFQDVTYEIHTVGMTQEFKSVYDGCVRLWWHMINYLNTKKPGGRVGSKFWSNHQRFFLTLCVSSKVPYVVNRSKFSVEPPSDVNGVKQEAMAVIIGLQSTGQAGFRRDRKNRDASQKSIFDNPFSLALSILNDCIEGVLNIKSETQGKAETKILTLLDGLKEKLMRNPIDHLISSLGGADKVSELTSRVERETEEIMDGVVCYSTGVRDRNATSIDHQRFQNGATKFAIISDAASTGISLHSNKSAKSKFKRLHITMELPWSADKAVQQFGRTHRSNQEHAPHYLMVVSPVPAERRFSFAIAERLELMGAITHGDRRAAETSSLSDFVLDRNCAKRSIENILKSFCKKANLVVDIYTTPLLREKKQEMVRQLTQSGILKWNRIKSKNPSLLKNVLSRNLKHRLAPNYKCYDLEIFLNRLFTLELDCQEDVITLLSYSMEYFRKEDQKSGEISAGVKDIFADSSTETEIYVKESSNFNLKMGGFAVLSQVVVDTGIEWDCVLDLIDEARERRNWGFFKSKHQKPMVLLAIRHEAKRFRIVRPSTGIEPDTLSIEYVKLNRDRIRMSEAEELWKIEHAEMLDKKCWHEFSTGSCSRIRCHSGSRITATFVLSGCVTKIWNHIKTATSFQPMEIVRCKLSTDEKIIGIIIPVTHVDSVLRMLSQQSIPEGDNMQIDP